MAAQKTTWIVVADSAHARFYAVESSKGPLAVVPDRQLDAAHAKIRDMVSDRQGRSFDSAGYGRHAMEPEVDPRRKEALDLTHGLAACLEEDAEQHRYQRLILVAAPRTLGDLRAVLPKKVAALVVGELDKELIHLGPQELAQHLADAELL